MDTVDDFYGGDIGGSEVIQPLQKNIPVRRGISRKTGNIILGSIVGLTVVAIIVVIIIFTKKSSPSPTSADSSASNIATIIHSYKVEDSAGKCYYMNSQDGIVNFPITTDSCISTGHWNYNITNKQLFYVGPDETISSCLGVPHDTTSFDVPLYSMFESSLCKGVEFGSTNLKSTTIKSIPRNTSVPMYLKNTGAAFQWVSSGGDTFNVENA
jgi:hypothetical protein